ncbi:MAG: hypothetical protein E7342_00960 [Clostridiales bacterium]|nr:hypothetical protein [Clostridiales bacterium]
MTTKDEGVHNGHRARMCERLFKNPNSFSDHELLEVLLYSVIKRRNTNDIAHKLLRTFGTLENLFEADAKSITLVSGVGDATAREIKVVGQILKKLKDKPIKKPELFSFANKKESIIAEFKGEINEKFIMYLLNDKHELVSKLDFKDHNPSSVSADIPEIVKAIALNSPYFAIIAHNHPSKNLTPTEADDFTTGKLNVICSMHGVNLVDHIIVSDDDAYSYFISGRMGYIRKYFNFDRLVSKNMEEILK